ncbi:hypothetical protein HK101_006502 [Irineochytrium annulatum]|nr:hypothetical protein HK101_006502 [Irineochytrium annulatum]
MQRARVAERRRPQPDVKALEENIGKIPEGVSQPFWESYVTIVDDLAVGHKVLPGGLRVLSYAMRNGEDAELFKDAIVRWRNHRPTLPQDSTDTALFADLLFSVRAHRTLLNIGCDRGRYGVHLTTGQIRTLMRRFREDALQTTPGVAVDEKAHVEKLDNLYKTFALLLYSGVPPDSAAYADLVTTGARGGTQEGWRRSLITAMEQLSLGLPFMEEAKEAMLDGFERSGDAETHVPTDAGIPMWHAAPTLIVCQAPPFSTPFLDPRFPLPVPGVQAMGDMKQRAHKEWAEERERLKLEEDRERMNRRMRSERMKLDRARRDAEADVLKRREMEVERRRSQMDAARTIQRYVRGYLVRKQFEDLKINDVAMRSHPEIYFMEKIIRELIQSELIPDLIVELCEENYFPLSMSLSLKIHRARYFLIEEVLYELMTENVKVFLHEFQAKGLFHTRELDAYELAVEDIAATVVADEAVHVVKAALQDLVDEYADILHCDVILESLVQEIIIDSKMPLKAVQCEEVFLEEETSVVLANVIDEVIQMQIKTMAFEISQELNRTIYAVKRRPRRSKTVDVIVDRLIDHEILTRLLDHISSSGTTVLSWEACERVVDGIILDSLLNRISSGGNELG